MSSLNELLQQMPDWIEIESSSFKRAVLLATSVRDSGAPGTVYSLTIEQLVADRIQVFETPAKRKLPECCVERHINPDTSFCLHLNSANPIESPKTARDWWASLGRYLSNQDYASRFRRWPLHQGLSHGDAAITQIEMEKLADTVGWKNEILGSMFRGKGFLHDSPLRLSKDRSSFVNLRSPCPRGCRRLHFPHRKESCDRNACEADCQKTHPSILRASCPNRGVIELLNRLELKRQAQEKELLDYLRHSGTSCCGTMRDCPLTQDDRVRADAAPKVTAYK